MQSHAESENVAIASGTSSNSASYSLRKKKLVIEFIEALKKLKPCYDTFLTKTKDLPSHFTMDEAEVLFVMLGGKDEKWKKVKTLNLMLIDWIGSRRKLDGGFPSPATINSDLLCFFAATKDMFDWNYSPADFKYNGGYNGYFTKMVADRQKVDVSTLTFHLPHPNLPTLSFSYIIHSSTPSSFIFTFYPQPNYGVKNKNCQLKADDVDKIVLALFDERIHRQHVMKCLFGSGLYACFRGNQEHADLTLAQIQFGNFPLDFPDVELRGKPYVAIDHLLLEKSHKITVTNSYARPMNNLLRFPITDDPSCFGGALSRLYRKAGPGQKRLYCREASDAEKARHALQGYPDATMSPGKHFGKDTIRALFKEGAVILGLPSDFKPHSLRGACITKLVNDPSVSFAETMAVARHSSVSASKAYQRVDAVSEANRLCCFGLVKKVPGASKPTSVATKPSSTAASVPVVPSPRSSSSSSSASSPKVDFDEWGDPLDDGTDFVLAQKDSSSSCVLPTQVGIEELKAECAEVDEMISPPRKKPPANREVVHEMRQVVLGLKKRLQNREKDILYYRSQEHDFDVRMEELRAEIQELNDEVRKLKRENSEYERILRLRDPSSGMSKRRRRW